MIASIVSSSFQYTAALRTIAKVGKGLPAWWRNNILCRALYFKIYTQHVCARGLQYSVCLSVTGLLVSVFMLILNYTYLLILC